MACILQQSSSIRKFPKYGRIRKQGKGTKIFVTLSVAYECNMKRLPDSFAVTGLNLNVSITDLVVFISIYVKQLNKVNCSVSIRGLVCCFFFFPHGRLQYGQEVGI